MIGVETRRFAEMTGALLATTHQRCPKCGKGRLIPDDAELSMRRCDACGEALPLEEIGKMHAVEGGDEGRRAICEKERRYALHMIVASELLVVAGAIWAVVSGSWATLAGAIVIAFVLLMNATVARYRAWQIEHARMFEARAPFRDYLSWEAANIAASWNRSGS